MLETIVWVVLMVVFLVVEASTGAFVAVFLALGAAVAALLSGLGIPIGLVIVGFAGSTIAGIGLLRRPIVRATSKGHYRLVSGPMGMVGEEGVVVRKVDGIGSPGLVRIRGEDWPALSEDDEIPEGERVMVLELRGSRLVVRKSHDGL